MYASDFDQHDINALKKTAEFASIYDAVIVVLAIFFSNEQNDTEVMSFKLHIAGNFLYPGLEYDFRISENVNQAITDCLQESGAELPVEKEKSLMGKLFEEDCVKWFSIHTSVPFLSYNTQSGAE